MRGIEIVDRTMVNHVLERRCLNPRIRKQRSLIVAKKLDIGVGHVTPYTRGGELWTFEKYDLKKSFEKSELKIIL